MVLEVRKAITMLEECCLWYIFTAKLSKLPQISLQILRKAAAKSVILGCKKLKKVSRNPVGTNMHVHVRENNLNSHKMLHSLCSKVQIW